MPIGISVAEPEIGVGIGEPYQASAPAVVNGGDEVDRLGIGDGTAEAWRSSVPAEAGTLLRQ